MGNDIAGGRVLPILEVLDCTEANVVEELAKSFTGFYPVCAVTQAQSRPLSD